MIKTDMVELADIYLERMAQDEKWGEQNHPDGTGGEPYKSQAAIAKRICDWHAKNGSLTWTEIWLEEIWEALAEDDEVRLMEELNQVAAVAVAWIQAIKRRRVREGRSGGAEPTYTEIDGHLEHFVGGPESNPSESIQEKGA